MQAGIKGEVVRIAKFTKIEGHSEVHKMIEAFIEGPCRAILIKQGSRSTDGRYAIIVEHDAEAF